MKKNLYTFLCIICSLNFYSQKKEDNAKFSVEKSTIILLDNSEIEGTIDFPIADDKKPLKYKNANGKDKVERDQISKVIFITNKGNIEYVSMKVYNLATSKVDKTPKLLINILKGKVSLFVSSYINNQFSYTASVNSFRNHGVGFTNFYCIRDGEEAASLIHVDSNYANKNAFFRQLGRKYFADNSQIATKIDIREYTYKNLFEVIELYNSIK